MLTFSEGHDVWQEVIGVTNEARCCPYLLVDLPVRHKLLEQTDLRIMFELHCSYRKGSSEFLSPSKFSLNIVRRTFEFSQSIVKRTFDCIIFSLHALHVSPKRISTSKFN